MRDESDTDDTKQRQLDRYRLDRGRGEMTTQQGVPVHNTDDSVTAGERGPTLLEDFHAREKLGRMPADRGSPVAEMRHHQQDCAR
ncbi:MAG: catalase [Nocardia sp.]|nr:catalase [Nocardia sp.]